MRPGDTVLMEADHEDESVTPDADWFLLEETKLGKYIHPYPDKSPEEGELWYSNGGYYAVESEKLVLVYVVICLFTYEKLAQGVLDPKEKYVSIEGVKWGDDWSFVNSDWKKALLKICERNISDPAITLFGDDLYQKALLWKTLQPGR